MQALKLKSYLVLDSIQRMDHPYNHYRKHKPDCDLQRYNKLKCHTSPGMDLYNVRWCMLGLPDTQTVVYILVDSLVRVRYSLANKSIQLSNQPHGTVSMGRKDLVHISVFQAQCIMVVLRFNFCFMQFSNKMCFVQKKERKMERRKRNAKLIISCYSWSTKSKKEPQLLHVCIVFELHCLAFKAH